MTNHPAPSPAARLPAVARGAMVRARQGGRTARSTLDRTLAALRRRGRGFTGVTGVPKAAWSRAAVTFPDSAPALERILPLPPALRLSRWLWGTTTAGQDGGDRTEARLGLEIGPDDAETPVGSFTTGELAALLSGRPWQHWPARSPRLVILTAAGQAGAVRDAVRAAGARNATLVVEDPGPARRAELLSLLSTVAVPSGPRSAGLLVTEAQAAGIMVLTHAPTASLPEDLGSPGGRRVAGRAARHALASAAGDLLLPAVSQPPASARIRMGLEPRRVVVAGHDLKFASGLVDHLREAGHDVRLDPWTGHARHDPEASRRLADWADVVLCEWALGNAVWYSRHTPAATRLTVRLHLQEAATVFPGQVDTARVDRAVFVAEHVRRQVVRDHGWPAQRSIVVPNAVRIPGASGPRDPNLRFRLGLVGMVPARKGMHTALDVLALLRGQDERYRLSLRGHRPEDVAWLRGRPAELEYFRAQLERITTDDRLREAVDFSPHGPDMDRWFAGIGVVLSTSDYESFHFTIPDGAAHGCVPRSLAWPGADLLYPAGWLAPDAAGLAEAVQRATAEPESWQREAERSRFEVATRYDREHVLPRLAAEVLGLRPAPGAGPSTV
ncbi:glycosyltransferase family 4 protein [Citricoccus nitrophenolicus]|uniref:Glycosyltransferase family 4 protein n=1 Tax=Citricoccus nitrophenolicus TaxID=863575 RepID=A0ABV0IED7_9MICC|nr:glycosyltransferase family 4 protein [Citricoccus sp. I39-566]WMY77082.1 glycosyltransferase family 4 protein [Citricoccus sp. I39-566]